MLVTPVLTASALLASTAKAWNKDVHQQIGYSASTLLTPSAKHILSHLLPPNSSIGLSAAWADDYAHTPSGAYSYQWHWIDSADNPPYYCNVFYNRDCTKGGCVVSAIANQTEILRGCVEKVKRGEVAGGSDVRCEMALKWVVHFLGDVAQPLHASGVAAGGNGIDVVFGGRDTELHAVWDGWIVYADANVTGFSNNTIQPYFQNLVSRIRKDDFSVPTREWIACTDPSTPIECALSWARDSNALTCDYVYSQAVNGTDLATSGYATGAFPIVEMQIGKAVLRLATWLNRLVAGEYDRGREVVVQTNPSWLLGPNGGE